MKENWKDLTIRDLVKIREIDSLQLATTDEKNLKVAALLAGIPYEKMLQIPLNEVRDYMDKTEFLLHEPKIERARNRYEINGRRYTLIRDASEMTVAQYLDFQQLFNEGFDKKPAELLSIFLVPEKHSYNDGYDKEQVIDDMYDFPVVEGLGVCDFFIKRSRRSIRLMLMSLRIRMKWMTLTARKTDKEMMKTLELEMKLMLDQLDSIYGCLL